jgi:hypothetical protein
LVDSPWVTGVLARNAIDYDTIATTRLLAMCDALDGGLGAIFVRSQERGQSGHGTERGRGRGFRPEARAASVAGRYPATEDLPRPKNERLVVVELDRRGRRDRKGPAGALRGSAQDGNSREGRGVSLVGGRPAGNGPN